MPAPRTLPNTRSCHVVYGSCSHTHQRAPHPLGALRRDLQEHTGLLATGTVALAGIAHLLSPGLAQAAAEQAAAAAAAAPYVPTPYQPGWEIWAGAFFGTFPFVIASIEFGKRIAIQRRCPECRGKGLVPASGPAGLKGRLRKCPQCGGMLPWAGWKLFWFGSPGNGGPLMQPLGQRSILYKVPPRPPQQEEEAGAGRQQSPSESGGGSG